MEKRTKFLRKVLNIIIIFIMLLGITSCEKEIWQPKEWVELTISQKETWQPKEWDELTISQNEESIYDRYGRYDRYPDSSIIYLIGTFNGVKDNRFYKLSNTNIKLNFYINDESYLYFNIKLNIDEKILIKLDRQNKQLYHLEHNCSQKCNPIIKTIGPFNNDTIIVIEYKDF